MRHRKVRYAPIPVCLLGALHMAGCTGGPPPRIHQASVGVEDAAAAQPAATGALIVYSATFSPTSEQSEYPVHTDYTITAIHGDIPRRVMNRTGPFEAFPATVTLLAGDYQVRAQYDGGRFVVIPVAIQAGKTTTVDLTRGPLPEGAEESKQPVRLPDGAVVGWSRTE